MLSTNMWDNIFGIILVLCITIYHSWKRYLEYKQNKKFDE